MQKTISLYLRNILEWFFRIALGSSASLKKKNASVLEQLLLQDELGNSKISISVEECISRDVKRTFPRHQFFTDPCTSGQLHLFQLLVGYHDEA